jgi:hypothetical protein
VFGLSVFIYYIIVLLFSNIATNVLVLGAVADFGAQNCQYSTKFDAW